MYISAKTLGCIVQQCLCTTGWSEPRPRRPRLFQTSSSTLYISWTGRVNRHPQSITCYCSPGPCFCLNKSNVVSALYVCCRCKSSCMQRGRHQCRTQEAAIFIRTHSEPFPASIKAHWKATGIANWATFLWNMSHEARRLCKSQRLKDTIWWPMSRTASRSNSTSSASWFLQHMIHAGDLTNSPLSWKHVVRCHCPGPQRYLWCNLNEAIMPHKQTDLMRCVD